MKVVSRKHANFLRKVQCLRGKTEIQDFTAQFSFGYKILFECGGMGEGGGEGVRGQLWRDGGRGRGRGRRERERVVDRRAKMGEDLGSVVGVVRRVE